MKKEVSKKHRRRAMTSEQARQVRQSGHDDAKKFAGLIGLPSDYQNDPQAKKDVVDLSGDAHSVKSGMKKWQIFLYSPGRFEKDSIFKRLNGLGQLFLDCLNVFPTGYENYKKKKSLYKDLLKSPMRVLRKRLENKETLKAFFEKSFFNAGEVSYLTIKNDKTFHVFHGDDVTRALANNIAVENSKARQRNQLDDQKVVFKHEGKTIGEIEMRNDSSVHFKEIKFWMHKVKTTDLLQKHIAETKKLKPGLFIYGKALKTFKRCGK